MRYELNAVREYTDRNGEKKTAWNRVGIMFPAKQGDGFTILLDAVPAPQDGQFKIIARPPKQREQGQPGYAAQSQAEYVADDSPW